MSAAPGECLDVPADVLIDTDTDGLIDVKGKCDFSLAGDVVHKAAEPPVTPCSTHPLQPWDRRDEFANHLTAALDVLSPGEQHRLMTALCQPSTDACVDALWSLCTCSTSDSSEVETGALHSSWEQFKLEECRGSSQCRPVDGPSGCTQPDAVDTATDTKFCGEARSMASWTHAGFRAQPPVGFNYPSHDQLPGAEHEPVASQKRARVPTKKLLGSELGCDFESFKSEDTIAKKNRKKPAKSSPKPSAAPIHSENAEVVAQVIKLHHQPSGRLSLRDRIWGLLNETEQKRLVNDQMSAAEGAKKLLARRAEALGCKVVEIKDTDTWNIELKLMACKGQSEPLKDPRTCCLCLREKSVLTKHNYYCRRCQLIYRAIHRKKQQPDIQVSSSAALVTQVTEQEVHE